MRIMRKMSLQNPNSIGVNLLFWRKKNESEKECSKITPEEEGQGQGQGEIIVIKSIKKYNNFIKNILQNQYNRIIIEKLKFKDFGDVNVRFNQIVFSNVSNLKGRSNEKKEDGKGEIVENISFNEIKIEKCKDFNFYHQKEENKELRLSIFECENFKELKVGELEFLNIFKNGQLQEIPSVKTKQHLRISDCVNLKSIGEGTEVGGNMDLRGCVHLKKMSNINVGRNMYLGSEYSICFLESISNIDVEENMDLRGCVNLKRISNIKVGGNMDLSGCERLKSISNIDVEGNMDLSGCERLRSMGKINVGKNMDLSGFSSFLSISEIKKNVKVGGKLKIPNLMEDNNIPEDCFLMSADDLNKVNKDRLGLF